MKGRDTERGRGLSPSYRAILAYGKALSLLVALHEREEFYAMIAQLNLPAIGYRTGSLVAIGNMWRMNCPVCKQPMEKKSLTDTVPCSCGKYVLERLRRCRCAIRSILAPR